MSTLVVVVETEWGCWGGRAEAWAGGEAGEGEKGEEEGGRAVLLAVHSVAAFAASHLLRGPHKRLMVLAAASPGLASSSALVYPRPSDSAAQGPAVSALVARRLLQLLRQESQLEDPPEQTGPRKGGLAKALARGLCFVRAASKGSTRASERPGGQVVVVSAGEERGAGAGLEMEWAVQAAGRLGVRVSGAGLAGPSAALSQAAEQTGGEWRELERPERLWEFLVAEVGGAGRPELRPALRAPTDFRPGCFCHRRLLSSGWVCSVCLAVFCAPTPICSTCHSAFRLKPALLRKRKRRANPSAAASPSSEANSPAPPSPSTAPS